MGIKNLLVNIIKTQIQKYKLNKERENKIYDYIDFKKIQNKKIKEIKRVIFVIPSMIKYSGGHTSILRLGTELAKEYDVVYASYKKDNIKDMKEAARLNLDSYQGEITNLENIKTEDEDILVATFWESVYFTKNLKGYKMYFVQDYEPYFYSYGEKYVLASKTYEIGYHVVSLGKWNITKIIDNNKMKEKINLDYIDFPYEKKEYPYFVRDFKKYSGKEKIKICVYVKNDTKRMPNLIENLLGKFKTRLEKEKNIKLEINYFGNEKYLKLKYGKSLGKLRKEELYKLYQESDFGLVASLTNISLVPYEMLATGLPVIEFIEGSFLSFFSEDAGILIDFDYETLYHKFLKYIENYQLLEKTSQKAQEELKKLSWKNSGEQFIEIIRNKILKNDD